MKLSLTLPKPSIIHLKPALKIIGAVNMYDIFLMVLQKGTSSVKQTDRKQELEEGQQFLGGLKSLLLAS